MLSTETSKLPTKRLCDMKWDDDCVHRRIFWMVNRRVEEFFHFLTYHDKEIISNCIFYDCNKAVHICVKLRCVCIFAPYQFSKSDSPVTLSRVENKCDWGVIKGFSRQSTERAIKKSKFVPDTSIDLSEKRFSFDHQY